MKKRSVCGRWINEGTKGEGRRDEKTRKRVED